MARSIDRRQLLSGAVLAGGGLAFAAALPTWARPVSTGLAQPLPTVSGAEIALTIHRMMMTIDGHQMHAIGVNGTVPAPLIRILRATGRIFGADVTIYDPDLDVDRRYAGLIAGCLGKAFAKQP